MPAPFRNTTTSSALAFFTVVIHPIACTVTIDVYTGAGSSTLSSLPRLRRCASSVIPLPSTPRALVGERQQDRISPDADGQDGAPKRLTEAVALLDVSALRGA
jgi:hypothetical protein